MARTCVERHGQRIGERGRPDREDVAADLGADAAEQLARDGADRDPRSGFAGAGPLENVPDVAVPVLGDAGEVGVSGARPGDDRAIDAGRVGGRRRFDRHGALPVLPVLVGNEQRDRRAGRHAVADAAQDLGAVGLDRHAAAAAVAELPPAQLRGDGREVEGQAGRNALEDRDERLSVRFAGGQKSQHRMFHSIRNISTVPASRRR